MEPTEYYAALLAHIRICPYVDSISLSYEAGTESQCYVEGAIQLIGGHRLYVAEYLTISPLPVLHKYRYHLQRSNGTLLCRWDNAPHHPKSATHPHHCHTADGTILPSTVRALEDVLASLPLYLDA